MRRISRPPRPRSPPLSPRPRVRTSSDRQGMRENLHRFFRAARGAGVRLSPAESIDAMRAVSKVGFADRTILRDTFLLTLAKTQDEKKALGDCFDLFFDQPEPAQQPPEDSETDKSDTPESGAASETPGDASGGDEAEDLGPLAQMLLSQDRNAMAAAIANASNAASLSDIRYFTQRGIFPGRTLDPLGIQRKRHRRGHLDVRRTIRRNAAWGGVPFLTAWKRRHRDKPKIIALCDVSGSVARVSDFFLLLIHSLHEVVSDVRSFAFSGHLIEVSDILESKSPEEAMAEIMSKVGFGSSDYGNSFADFEHEWMNAITPQTTVIVLGDARSNNLDPRADILRRIGERSKRLVWLNPEGRMAWGWGDSEMPRYSTFCTVVRQCATAQQLERAVSDIVASYQ